MNDQTREQKTLGPPKCHPFLAAMCNLWLRLMGWKIEGETPDLAKFVVILAPHTSNWDGFLILPAAFAMGMKFNFLGKKELFNWPLGGLVKMFGGIPVDRKASEDLVSQILTQIDAHDQIVIAIAPEGTRRFAQYWKSGFYHITLKSELPLCFAYLDYDRKVAGFNKGMVLSGDIDKDMSVMRNFFSKVNPKHPDRVGEIAFKPQA